jgi:streptogramin lyase
MQRPAAIFACLALISFTNVEARSAPLPETGEIARVTTAGEFTHYPLPAGYSAESIASGSDGAVWFIESDRNGHSKIGRLTTDRSLREFVVSAPRDYLSALTAGADGALWFLKGNAVGNAVGRLTTSGTYSEHALPRGNVARGLVTGPDGALWITQTAGKTRLVAPKTLRAERRIGRMTSAGVYTEYALPTSDVTPDQITPGPDGALWFTQLGWGYGPHNRLGHITTAGAFREYRVPGATSITAGPHGAIWFASSDDWSIGRLTASGTVSSYTLPSKNGVRGIMAGQDGAIWYFGYPDGKVTTPGRLGRVSTSGAIKEYPLPRSYAHAITSGPDGAIWVAM